MLTNVFLVLTALAAVADWIAVARGMHRAELVLKPLTLALLVVAAAGADLGSIKPFVVAALVLGLIGDIALMFSTEGSADSAFIAGLSAFLLGHLAYIVAFLKYGQHTAQLLGGLLIAIGVMALLLPRILAGVRRVGGAQMLGPVVGYITALTAMGVLAIGTGSTATAIGGALFVASDATLAWQRFVAPLPRGPVIVIVTYHLAQILILIGLIQ
jgi:uncharacterized membrane protein YhhN